MTTIQMSFLTYIDRWYEKLEDLQISYNAGTKFFFFFFFVNNIYLIVVYNNIDKDKKLLDTLDYINVGVCGTNFTFK